MRKSTVIAGGVAALLLTPILAAQAQTTPTDSDTPSRADTEERTSESSGKSAMEAPSSEEFVKKAVQANFDEMDVSQLALTKAKSADVKSFAQKMIDDHSQANSELAQLAKTQNLKVPRSGDFKHDVSQTMLKMKSGESFDTAYMEAMDKDHQQAIELFQAASSSASKLSPELKAFATKMLPKLQAHHQLVAQVEQSLPTRAASKSSGATER